MFCVLEVLACFAFMKHPFWDSPFCLITDDMTLKTKKLDQGATEMFISEFEKEESLWNVMSEIYKNCDAKLISKDFLDCLRWVVINSTFFLASLWVSRDSISLVLKENKFHIYVLTTFTRGVFRTQPNVKLITQPKLITIFAKTLHHRCSTEF